MSGVYQLHTGEAPAVSGVEEQLLAFGEFDGRVYGDGNSRLLGTVLHAGEPLIREHPLALEEREVADWLFLLWREPFIVSDKPVRVPLEQILVRVNHKPMVIWLKTTAALRIQIEHGQ
jgi:hypothetical protein